MDLTLFLTIKFSVKLAYREAVKQNELAYLSFIPSSLMWKMLWKLSIPPKFKHFWWKVCVNVIASKENLWRGDYALDPFYPRCNKEIESIEHIVFRCSYAKKVWSSFPEASELVAGNIPFDFIVV